MDKGKEIQLEHGFGAPLIDILSRREHQIQVPSANIMLGRGQIILRSGEGVLCGASEPRTDGMATAW